jgi:ADP-dependent NAD(P)H-hydrate dehydratase / NAD(P)H-hydrate epimerase
MKILSVSQIQDWDAFTITHEPVSSLGLMERAATRCFACLKDDLLIQFPNLIQKKIHVFCGQGNNGGDGLVLARYFKNEGYQVQVHVLKLKESGSIDFEINLQRAKAIDVPVQFLELNEQIAALGNIDICLDALFGSGLTRVLDGLAATCVQHINTYAQFTASIDIPSGLFGDIDLAINQDLSAIIQAQKTYTFQAPKSAFLFSETGEYAGECKVIDIDLHPDFLVQAETDYSYQKQLNLPSRNLHSFGQKWQNGHALLVAGSKGKMGAAILCTKAALRAGAGLVTAHVPSMANNIIQTAFPEAMLSLDISDNTISEFPSLKSYTAVGIGPGLGTAPETQLALIDFLENAQLPLVLDADALNCLALAKQQEIAYKLPAQTILTPHAKEFDRLFGSNQNTFERLKLAQHFAQQWQVIIVLKGRFTQIVNSDGKVVFNGSGNALLATAGSGDVLTGIITSLLAQGFPPIEAAKLAVNWHGQLAERLAQNNHRTIIASDLVERL